MSGNSLKINKDKTEFIIFSCKSDQYNHLSLNIVSEIIHPSKSVKILGETLDSNMNMQQDVVNTCRSSYIDGHESKPAISILAIVQESRKTSAFRYFLSYSLYFIT